MKQGLVQGNRVGWRGALVFPSEYFDSADAPLTGRLKMWDGAAFMAYPLKHWNGTSWGEGVLKHYNGTIWQPGAA